MLEVSASSANTSAYRRWRRVANRTFNEQRDSDCSVVLDASFQFVIRHLTSWQAMEMHRTRFDEEML